MKDIDDRNVEEAGKQAEILGVNEMIAKIIPVKETKLRFIMKKKYWFLNPCDISGSSIDNILDKMKASVFNGTFWNLNTDAMADVLMEQLPAQLDFVRDLPPEMLQPAFGGLGECFYNLLNPDDDCFILNETKTLIRKNLSFIGWDEQSVLALFYDMKIKFTIRKTAEILSLGGNAEKAKTCHEISKDFMNSLQRLSEISDAKNHLEFSWTGSNELNSVNFKHNDILLTAKTCRECQDTVMSDLVDCIIQETKIQNQKKEKIRSAMSRKEEEQIREIAKKSKSYGSVLGSCEVDLVTNATTKIPMQSLIDAVQKRYPLAEEFDILDTMQELIDEGIVQAVSYGNRQPCYEVLNLKLAKEYSDPMSFNYGNNTDYGKYTDTDWTVLMQKENGKKHKDETWIDYLQILDHTFLLEEKTDAVKEFFSFAPQSIRDYLKIQASLEENEIKKELLQKVC